MCNMIHIYNYEGQLSTAVTSGLINLYIFLKKKINLYILGSAINVCLNAYDPKDIYTCVALSNIQSYMEFYKILL